MATADRTFARRRFALEIFDYLRALGVTDGRYDPEAFRIRFDGDRQVLELAPLERRLGDRTPEERREWAAAELPALLAGGPDDSEWDRVRPLLRPVLRRWTHRLTDPGPRIRRPLQPPLDEVVVVDVEGVLDYPAPERLHQWGVSADEVFEIARRNLAATLSLVDHAVEADSAIVLTGDHAPVCAVLTDWLAYTTRDFRHRPVVFVPDSRTLILVDGAEDELAEHYRRVGRIYRDSKDPLSPQGYVLDAEGGLLQHAVLAGVFAPAHRARTTMVTAEYSVLSEWLRRQADPGLSGLANIESFRPLLHRMGRQGLAVTWPEGRPAVLPETDYLSFDYPEGRTLVLPFSLAAELAGLTPVPDILPRLYRTDGRPGPEVMATLERLNENMDLFERICSERAYSDAEWLEHMRHMADVLRGLPPAEARSMVLAELERGSATGIGDVEGMIRAAADRIGRADAVRLLVAHTTWFGGVTAEFTITWSGYAGGTLTDRGHSGKAEFVAAPGFFAVLANEDWWAIRASGDHAAPAGRWIRLGTGPDWSSSVLARAFGVSIAEECHPEALAGVIRRVGATVGTGAAGIALNPDGVLEVRGIGDQMLHLDGRPPYEPTTVFVPARGGRVLDPHESDAAFAEPHCYEEPLWGGDRSIHVAIGIVAVAVDAAHLPGLIEDIRARAEVAVVGAMPRRPRFAVTDTVRGVGHILLDSVRAFDSTPDVAHNIQRVNASMERMHDIDAVVHTHHDDGRVEFDLSAPMNSALFLIDELTRQVAELSDRTVDQVIDGLRAVLDETATPSAPE